MKIEKHHLEKATDFKSYEQDFAQQAASGGTSGPLQNEEMATYTKLNWQRNGRVYKTLAPNDELIHTLNALPGSYTLLAITETWCGDAAQSLPVFKYLADHAQNIELLAIYRDNSTGLIDEYLTNGSKSIPKVLLIDNDSNEALWDWGPRPKEIQDWFMQAKAVGSMSKADQKKEIQRWYNKDKGRALQKEILALTKELEMTKAAS